MCAWGQVRCVVELTHADFKRKLTQSPELSVVRKGLKGQGFPMTLLPSTALVLVEADQYLETVNSPTLRSRKLKRYNITIAERFEHLMNEVLSAMASKKRPCCCCLTATDRWPTRAL